MSNGLSPQARALLRASRSFDDPSDADSRRVRASVIARVGTAAGIGAAAELRRGDADAALARLAEHAVRYPSGALVYEREGVRAIALCRSGRIAEGRAVADRFLGSARKSSLAMRVRTACAIDKPAD